MKNIIEIEAGGRQQAAVVVNADGDWRTWAVQMAVVVQSVVRGFIRMKMRFLFYLFIFKDNV